MSDAPRPFAWRWVGMSVAVYLAFGIAGGMLLGGWLSGAAANHAVRLQLEGLFQLTSYFAGGLVVGVISPGPRLLEPAVGAAIAVALAFVVAVFTPLVLMQGTSTLLAGAALAFGVALFGAHLGERWTGH